MRVATNLLTEYPHYLAFRRADQSPWATAAVSTLHVYRESAERREP